MSEVKTPDEIWYRISEEDISCLQDYIDAALRGDESIEAIKRLVEQEWGIIRSRKVTEDVLEKLERDAIEYSQEKHDSKNVSLLWLHDYIASKQEQEP
jgi:hypothetical protein